MAAVIESTASTAEEAPSPDPRPETTRGCGESFDAEVLPHIDFLYRYAVRLTGDPTFAEDLVQDAVLRSFRAWHQFQPGTNVRAWLATILRNAFINEYRRDRRRVSGLEDGELDRLAAHTGSDSRDAETDYFHNLIDEEVLAAIDALPDAFREPLVLSDMEDVPYVEIARILGIPVGTVKSRIFRARRILQDRLYEYAVEMGYVSPRRETPAPS